MDDLGGTSISGNHLILPYIRLCPRIVAENRGFNRTISWLSCLRRSSKLELSTWSANVTRHGPNNGVMVWYGIFVGGVLPNRWLWGQTTYPHKSGCRLKLILWDTPIIMHMTPLKLWFLNNLLLPPIFCGVKRTSVHFRPFETCQEHAIGRWIANVQQIAEAFCPDLREWFDAAWRAGATPWLLKFVGTSRIMTCLYSVCILY